MDNEMVTCSFTMNRDLYNNYKSIITKNGENVKGNLVKYMQSVINSNNINKETEEAIEEVKNMKLNTSYGKVYNSSDDMFKDLLDV